MVYKNFRLNLWLRVLALLASFLLLSWLWLDSPYFFTPIVFTLVVILQVVELTYYLERTNRRLANFFDAFRYRDFTRTFNSKQHGNSFVELETAMNEVMQSFQQIREREEATLQYLESIVRKLTHGLLVFDQRGDIVTVNEAARQLFPPVPLRNVREIQAQNQTLYQALAETPNGETTLIRQQIGNDENQLSISVSELKQRTKNYRIVSIKNISNELQTNELEAWQNLTRVLTHEIVNSITPISSTVSTVIPMLQNAQPLTPENRTDLTDAMTIINRRSEALLRLVQAYRSFTRIPNPDFKTLYVSNLFEDVAKLYQTDLDRMGIQLQQSVAPENLTIQADRELFTSILINLFKNAIEALANTPNPEITMIATLDQRQRSIIRIQDNGAGIIEPAIGKIFIPFYSTKPQGSGIGLSLCRKIMTMHRGFIRVESTPNQKTVFTLTFPAQNT
jgi:nitrogen fixation/metabolism regulation signal transduction histidine kinase